MTRAWSGRGDLGELMIDFFFVGSDPAGRTLAHYDMPPWGGLFSRKQPPVIGQ